MTQMIRVQGDTMSELANILHGVDEVSDIEWAAKQIETLGERMKQRMARISKSLGKDDIPSSASETKRLQSAMQREVETLEPVMKRIEKEMKRLENLDWSKPLLETVKKSNFKAELKSK